MLLRCLALLAVLAQPLAAQGVRDLVIAAGEADRAGDLDGAAEHLGAALTLLMAQDPMPVLETAVVSDLLAKVELGRDNPAGALVRARFAATMMEQLDAPPPPLVLAVAEHHGLALLRTGAFAEAEVVMSAQLPLARAARAAGQEGRLPEALLEVLLHRRETERAAALLSESALFQPDTRAEHALFAGRIAAQEGRADTAVRLLTRAQRLAAQEPDGGVIAARSMFALGDNAVQQGDFAAAEYHFLRARIAYERALGGSVLPLAQIDKARALIRIEIGQPADAIALFSRARAEARALGLSSRSPFLLAMEVEQVAAIRDAGDSDAALAEARRLIAAYRTAGLEGTYEYRVAHATLGRTLMLAGRAQEAEALLLPLMAGGAMELRPADRIMGALTLAEGRLGLGDPEGALRWAEEALDLLAAGNVRAIEREGEALRLRAAALTALGRPDARGARAALVQHIERALIARRQLPVIAAEVRPASLRAQVWTVAEPLLDPAAAGDTAAQEELFHALQLLHVNELSLSVSAVYDGAGRDDERRALWRELRYLETAITDGAATMSERAAVLERAEALIVRIEQPVAPRTLGGTAPHAPVTLRHLSDLRGTLEAGEVFWLHGVFKSGGVVMAISADGVAVARTDMGRAELAAEVERLRDSLTLGMAEAQGQAEGMAPVFDTALAARLYAVHFAPLDAQLGRADRVILTPDGALQAISLAVLIRDSGAPVTDAARYFGTRQALIVSPAPVVLQAQRRAQPAPFQGRFVGFGAPDLTGGGMTPGMALVNSATGLADPAALAVAFRPLPSTAQELSGIATVLGQGDVRLAAEATEAGVKATDFEGAAIVSFATHAVTSGDGLAEPALILTPPAVANAEDDGLLTAREVARLTMPVRLVILSACNTGAGLRSGGDGGLSGLAAGFFWAGADSVVASHWTVDSVFTAYLMEDFVTVTAAGTDPSDALREVMAFYAAQDHPLLNHPGLWGAFTVVGPS